MYRYIVCITNYLNVVRPSTEASPAILEVDEGDMAVFMCIVSGSPLPTAKWIEISSGSEITGEERTQTGTCV